MQILQRWRNLLILNNTVIQSARLGVVAAHLASLHSTNAFFEKWKNNLNSGVPRDKKPSKAHIKYIVRKKRSDTKKALNSILYNGGCSTSGLKIPAGYADPLNKKSRIKPAHHSKKAANKKLKRKHRREKQYDDHDDDPEKDFFSAFENASSWNFRHWEQRSERTENFDWSNCRFSEHEARSRTESQSFTLGTYADRKSLGLPTTGPLKIEDVKAVFRSSALKWHPDRHQDSSRAAAEAKFKHCVNAYRSLCESLSSR